MALAKNIKLMEGTVKVWEKCACKDIKSGLFNLKDFVMATEQTLRMKAYNRIDYYDVYSNAIKISVKRRLRSRCMCIICGAPMNTTISNISTPQPGLMTCEHDPEEVVEKIKNTPDYKGYIKANNISRNELSQ